MFKSGVVLFLFSLLITGCGGGDNEEVLTIDDTERVCTQRNVSYPFPGGTTCRGLSVSSSDIETSSGEYWRCSAPQDYSGPVQIQAEEYRPGGIYRIEVIQGESRTVDTNQRVNLAGRVVTGTWVLDPESCSLWATDSSCGNRGEQQITDVSDNSLVYEQVDPTDIDEIISISCERRRGAVQ